MPVNDASEIMRAVEEAKPEDRRRVLRRLLREHYPDPEEREIVGAWLAEGLVMIENKTRIIE